MSTAHEDRHTGCSHETCVLKCDIYEYNLAQFFVIVATVHLSVNC